MNQFQPILLLTPLTCSICCIGQPYEGQPISPVLSRAECLSLLKKVSPDWLKDTVNKNGWRRGIRPKFGWAYFERLDSLAGLEWQDVYRYLGLPDRIFIGNGTLKATPAHMTSCSRMSFYYNLSVVPENNYLSLSGSVTMTIIVMEGKIESVHWQYIDG